MLCLFSYSHHATRPRSRGLLRGNADPRSLASADGQRIVAKTELEGVAEGRDPDHPDPRARQQTHFHQPPT